jgi:hypothetical protein
MAFAPTPQTGYGLRRFLQTAMAGCAALGLVGSQSAAQDLRHCQSGTVPERPGFETMLHWHLNNRAKICQHS